MELQFQFILNGESMSAQTADIVIVMNPTSGRGKGARIREELEELLSKYANGQTWKIVETRGQRDGIRLARDAANHGAKVIAAAGGDGTINEVLNGVMGSDATLGILPLGTGNDVARTIGLGTDVALAVKTLFQGRATPTDVGYAKETYFLNVAGCGFDAAVAERANIGFRKLRGTAAYIAAVLDTLTKFPAAEIDLTVDGVTTHYKAMMCSIANCKTYGGGMRIAPDADIADGLLDVCVLKEAGLVEFILAFPRVFRGTHTTHPKVVMLQGKKIHVESSRPLPVLLDGDIFGTTPVTFEILPNAIRLMLPA